MNNLAPSYNNFQIKSTSYNLQQISQAESQTENLIYKDKWGGTFTSTKNHYSHIPPILKFSPAKNRSSLFQIESIQPVTYKPNISIYKERNKYY